MPFKSEKQRRYLWANEPEIARDWTDTYGSRIHKNEGGIMDMASEGDLYHTFENYRKGKQVTVPTSFQARSHSTPVHLAYITDDEAGILRALKPDTPHEGPMGIPNYNDYDPTGGGYGRATSGEQMSGMESRGGQTEQHRADARSLGYTPQEVRDIKGGAQQAAAMGQPKNLGINFSVPGQNFMRNIHPLRWAGNLIDNPFVSGAWSFLTSPLSGMSNLRQGMTQQEWEDARNERIRNKRIENILGRKAPITDMTLKNLERLGYTGEMPAVGSSPKMMNMNNLGLYTDRVNQPIGPGKRVGQDQGYYGLGSRYDNQGGIYNISRGNDLSEIEGQVADINMPVSGLVNYDQYLENVADWPEHGLKEQFEEEGLTTPESQKQFFDVFEESLREQSRGLKRKTPSISTEDIQKAIDAGLIVIT